MKEKRRSNEKRKEKSRDAARNRRYRESGIYADLADELPVPAGEVSHLDKASIMRLAIAHVKTRQLVGSVMESLPETESTSDMDELFLKALDGFLMVLDNNGDMVFLSENVKNYLGIAQMDLMGQSVFDYSHPCDHEEIRESISLKSSEISEDNPCNIFLRLKCTLTSKGRKVNLKSASYKVIHCTGRYVKNTEAHKRTVLVSTSSDDENNNPTITYSEEVVVDDPVREDRSGDEKGPPKSFLVLVASPVPHPSNIEIALGKYTFLSKHNLNMKFTYADDKLTEFLGWDGSELMGQSLFDFHHALDDVSLDKSFKSLFHKGQCETMSYRFLNKTGGYAWVVTQATLIHCARSQKPQSVVCVNYLLSGVEHEDEVCSTRQIGARAAASQLLKDSPKKVQVQAQSPPPPPPAYVAGPSLALPALSPIAQVVSPASLRRPLEPTTTTPHSVTKSLFLQACKPRAAVPAVPRVFKQDIENLPFEIKPNDDDDADQLLNPIIFPDEEDQELVDEVLKKSESTTANLFAPRTEDMNKGFLTFSEDQPGIAMLKEEPDDLTHLAPEAGDECVPLDDGPLLTDVLDEFLLSGNYCSLLGPEGPQDPLTEAVCRAQFEANFGQSLRSDSAGSSSGVSSDPLSINPSILGQSSADCLQLGDPLRDDCSSDGGDPFIYRDTPSRCSLGTDLPSPTMSKSLDGSGIDDSLSPTGSIGCGTGALSDEEMLMLGITDVAVDEEVNCKPFIAVNDNEEAMELLINNDAVMWGPRQSTIKKSKWVTNETKSPNSSLAQLLTNESHSSKKLKYPNEATLVNPSQVLGQISTKNNLTKINNSSSTAERSNKRTHALSSKSQNRQNQQQLLQQQQHEPNKRFKQTHNESSGISQFSNDMFNIANAQQKNSQLLQQLVSQNLPKSSRNMWPGQQQQLQQKANIVNNNIFNDNGNRLNSLNNGMNMAGKTGRSNALPTQQQQQQQQQQQSNSVLMNLLVSGCDIQAIQNQVLQEATLPNICAPKMDLIQNVKPQQQQQSVMMDAENFQALPFWDNVLDNTQSFLYNKQLQYQQQQQPQLLQQQPQQPQLFNQKTTTSALDQMSLEAAEFMFGPESDELLRALDPNLV
ncbi:protein similar-like [Trichogramma pretiosum]|uniref:protein similar-like n=1 Tax=Trichogramma pretiosum TaxID=7493 RepID=UPI0006C96B15|nr:protein similar-like [Trichogramma pretiosum]